MSLSRAPVAIRFFILFLVLSAPFAFLGGLFFGWAGLIAGLVVADFFLIWAAVKCEMGLVQAIGRPVDVSPGLHASFEQVHKQVIRRGKEEGQAPMPRLVVFADPLPEALSARGLGSSGTIILSAGLLAQLEEEELREVFRTSLLCLEETEWMFYTLCSFLAVLVFKVAPQAWVELFFSGRFHGDSRRLGPFSALRFAMVLPFVRFLLQLCRTAALRSGQRESQAGAWYGALHKVKIASQRSGKVLCPGAFMILLSHSDSRDGDESPFHALFS